MESGDQRADFSRGAASGVDSAYKSAHAGAGDVADRDVVFFKPGDNADMGEAERALPPSSTEADLLLGAGVCGGGFLLREGLLKWDRENACQNA